MTKCGALFVPWNGALSPVMPITNDTAQFAFDLIELDGNDLRDLRAGSASSGWPDWWQN
jgi:hypothetical protein